MSRRKWSMLPNTVDNPGAIEDPPRIRPLPADWHVPFLVRSPPPSKFRDIPGQELLPFGGVDDD